MRLRVRELDARLPGDLVTRATADTGLLRHAATSAPVLLVNGVVGLVGALAGLVLSHIRAATERAQEAVGLVGSALDRALGAARTVKANGAEVREQAAIDRASDQAFRAGLAGARAARSVHTWHELAVASVMEPFVDWPAIQDEEPQLLDRRLAELFAEWSEKHPDVAVRRLIVRDRPGRCLLEQSADAQLVVVESRGRGDLAAMALGSVGNALVHRAQCPVAVVRF